jgi:gliding motility-associated lipoprotein GldJ
MRKVFPFLSFVVVGLLVAGCGKPKSNTTGWKFNSTTFGGFEKPDFKKQKTGPNLVYIKGGTFTMGRVQQDLSFEQDAMPRQVSVTSFYMDETEITNLQYREYLHWLKNVYVDYPQVYKDALPDTLSWRRRLGYNEPFVKYYFRHPAYMNYPVVGVDWVQAKKYASWRSDRVNEAILINEGYIKPNINEQVGRDNFNTEAYLAGQYDPIYEEKKKSYDPDKEGRDIKIEDGILLPDYRLPTEAEWEYAALALKGEATGSNVNTRKVYPWKGQSLRKQRGDNRGKFRANFQRGRGDYMGVANNPNDASAILAPVRSYFPNDYGLYHMAGNVSEWVKDVYRPLTFEMTSDLNPYRGNVFKKDSMTEDGFRAPKDSLGRMQRVKVDETKTTKRRNYQQAKQKGFRDPMETQGGDQQYNYGVSTLINNEARVYKGGSWNDRAYFLSPGSRRFLDQGQAKPTLGFRCAMNRVGPPQQDYEPK